MHKYFGNGDDAAQAHDRTAVLITNLGTPEQPTRRALRTYLAEFLSDPRVVEFPRWLWKVVLYGVILNIRPQRSAAAYRKIWTEQGSPLLVGTENLAQKVAAQLEPEYKVFVAMRYGKPAIAKTLKTIHTEGFRKLIILPLYPQYSGSTSGSTFDAIADSFRQQRWLPATQFVSDYHLHPGYIKAVADSIRRHWQTHGQADQLLMSYHGIPQRYADNGDPYPVQCEQTSRAIANELDLEPGQWKLVYQSRFGREPWLQPYCDETLKQLPGQGIKNIDIVCPGFSIDCLETLEEIDQENRDYFLAAGGESFSYIPCLNDADAHTKMVATLVHESS